MSHLNQRRGTATANESGAPGNAARDQAKAAASKWYTSQRDLTLSDSITKHPYTPSMHDDTTSRWANGVWPSAHGDLQQRKLKLSDLLHRAASMLDYFDWFEIKHPGQKEIAEQMWDEHCHKPFINLVVSVEQWIERRRIQALRLSLERPKELDDAADTALVDLVYPSTLRPEAPTLQNLHDTVALRAFRRIQQHLKHIEEPSVSVPQTSRSAAKFVASPTANPISRYADSVDEAYHIIQLPERERNLLDVSSLLVVNFHLLRSWEHLLVPDRTEAQWGNAQRAMTELLEITTKRVSASRQRSYLQLVNGTIDLDQRPDSALSQVTWGESLWRPPSVSVLVCFNVLYKKGCSRIHQHTQARAQGRIRGSPPPLWNLRPTAPLPTPIYVYETIRQPGCTPVALPCRRISLADYFHIINNSDPTKSYHIENAPYPIANTVAD